MRPPFRERLQLKVGLISVAASDPIWNIPSHEPDGGNWPSADRQLSALEHSRWISAQPGSLSTDVPFGNSAHASPKRVAPSEAELAATARMMGSTRRTLRRHGREARSHTARRVSPMDAPHLHQRTSSAYYLVLRACSIVMRAMEVAWLRRRLMTASIRDLTGAMRSRSSARRPAAGVLPQYLDLAMAQQPAETFLDPVPLDGTVAQAFASHRARAKGIAKFFATTRPLRDVNWG
jgi:hypothetical protein